MRALYLLALFLLALPAAAQRPGFQGTVTHVTDGDTVWIRPLSGGAPVAVRLHGIDAPELCQPFGEQARHALAHRVLHRAVAVDTRGQDDWRRTLAMVQVSGQDVGAWLVFTGHAWSYRYRQRPGPYATLEAQARQGRRGLWAASGPLEPRRFRQQHGPCP